MQIIRVRQRIGIGRCAASDCNRRMASNAAPPGGFVFARSEKALRRRCLAWMLGVNVSGDDVAMEPGAMA
jgi:hypothetical protein